MNSSTKPVIYQVMTRLFGNTVTNNQSWGTIEENGVGKFNDINKKALKEIKKMGITHIWYTGVIEHALLTDYSNHGIHLDHASVVKGRAGSPYAIKDYYDVNPDLATDINKRKEEFVSLINRTHQSDLKVIIDFVPNHVARFYQSDVKPDGVKDLGANDDPSLHFSSENNYYYFPNEDFKVPEGYNPLNGKKHKSLEKDFIESPAKASGNDVFNAQPHVNDWFETIKLNYGIDYLNNRKKEFEPIPDTWLKMTDILLYWASKNIDGFRCDMAEMVPAEFWSYAISKVKEIHPHVIFIAEIYNPRAYREYIHTGFDYLYDKVELYDTLKQIIRKEASTDGITSIWQSQEGITANMLTFLENHDEQRIPSPDFAGNPWKAVPAMVLSATFNTGAVMIYFGQEVGEPATGNEGFSSNDSRTTIFDYWGVPEHQKWMNNGKFDGGQLSDDQQRLRGFYKELLNLCNESKAISQGNFFDLHYFNRTSEYQNYSDQVYSYLRYYKDEVLLFAINFSDDPVNCQINIPQHAFDLIKISPEEVIIEDFYNWNQKQKFNISVLTNQNNKNGFKASIGSNSYKIYKIR